MRPVVRQLLALLAAMALLGQASGLASALEIDTVIHCCCGDHDAGHACGCATCPPHGALRWRKLGAPLIPGSPLPALTSCHGRSASGTIPWVPALPPPPRLRLDPIASHGRLRSRGAPPLLDRLVCAVRPPP